MLISFFEEFPTKKNLDKLKLVTWPTKLYLAAKSLQEFNKIKNLIKLQIKNKNIKEFIYWPILEVKEGYWISPFTQRKALLRIFDELKENKGQGKNKNVSVMIDAELPTTKNPSLYFTQFFNFCRNKKLIRNFVRENKAYISEYYPSGKFKEKIMSFWGLHFDPQKHDNKVIKMVYHSMHHFNKEFIVHKLKEGKQEFGSNFLVAYGTTAIGMQGDEPILSYSQLEEDLKIAKNAGVKEVVIFRLGGLNEGYVEVMGKYS